jgi:hypothetical protein
VGRKLRGFPWLSVASRGFPWLSVVARNHAISGPRRSTPFKSNMVRTPLAKAVWGKTR